MGQPAARVGDMHACPLASPATPPVPHVGGPILPPGGVTVLIGGPPAARMGDMCTCVGPPDVIAKGEPTVLICGLPAARMGDPTVHGGVISVGLPTVLIGMAVAGGGAGGGAVPAPAGAVPGHSIEVKGTPEEKKKLNEMLDRLRKTEAGKKLLTDIDNAKEKITLEYGDVRAQGGGYASYLDGKDKASNGTGSKVQVVMDPTFTDNTLYVHDKHGNKIDDPPDVILAHELTHAMNGANGTRDAADPEGQAITGENKYRKERTPPLPERDPSRGGGFR